MAKAPQREVTPGPFARCTPKVRSLIFFDMPRYDRHRYFLIYALAVLKHIWFPSFSYHKINFISKLFIYFIYLSVMVYIKHSPIV